MKYEEKRLAELTIEGITVVANVSVYGWYTTGNEYAMPDGEEWISKIDFYEAYKEDTEEPVEITEELKKQFRKELEDCACW